MYKYLHSILHIKLQAGTFIPVYMLLLMISCQKVAIDNLVVEDTFELIELSKPSHYPGIAIYTADMAKYRNTEVNSEWVLRKSSLVNASSEILRNKYNAIHKIAFDHINNEDDYLEFVVAIHGKLVNRVAVPNEFLQNLKGISFRAVSYNVPIILKLEALNINGQLLKSQNFEVDTDQMRSYTMAINNQELHHLSFKILGVNQELASFRNGALGIDDVYLNNNIVEPFQPPIDNTQFIDWIKKSSIRYFLWNYKDIGGGRGVVLEASDITDKVSLSGIGYAYANYILAEHEHMISASLAKERILSMLRWQEAQNWYNGSEGVFGFPLHYYRSDGSGLWPESPQAISTIDWAICAAGLRTVKQKYSSDSQIVAICNALLNRPQWDKTRHNDASDTYKFGRISKGLSATTGEKNGQVWADAFSEETELVYLEALASGKINDLDLTRIYREQKNGYYTSWFGAGFTYNWLQLWTGPQEPYKSNSTAAFQSDATTANAKFGKPLMGLTACSTISSIESNGFINWTRYISNQGASVSGANSGEVIQISPAPYGAVLAIPFQPSMAIEALRTYVNIGYYHPLLGLPDNVRMTGFFQNLNVPVPNWSTYDLNIGAISMAIEQWQQNSLSNYYTNDNEVIMSLQKLIQSF